MRKHSKRRNPRKKRSRKKTYSLKDLVAGTAPRKGKKDRAARTFKAMSALKFHRVTDFLHLDLDADTWVILERLKEPEKRFFLLSDTESGNAEYYLSTADSLRGSFSRAGLNWQRPPELLQFNVKNTLRGGSIKIGAVRSIGPGVSVNVFGGEWRDPALVHLRNDKPSALLISPDSSAQSKLPAKIRDVVHFKFKGVDPVPLSQHLSFSKIFVSEPPVPGALPGSKASAERGRDDSEVPPQGPPPPVYPNIEVSDEHPVQNSTFDIVVSLQFERPEHTTGIVSMPTDDREYVVDVHLLLGRVSLWGQLTFQRPQGTKKQASFTAVKAPLLSPDKNNEVPERRLFDIYVNFYLENRWCGEAVRRIEVRASKTVANLAAIPVPEVPAWREDLLVAPGTQPPDLLVRIKRTAPLDFEWSLFSPHMNLPREPDELRTSLTDPPYRFVKDRFDVFSGATLSDYQLYSLVASCDQIFEATPRGFRKAYRKLYAAAKNDQTKRTKLETIQFVSDEAFIPWELMRVSDPSDPAFEPEILCVRHSVGRWMASDSCQLRNGLEVRKIVVFASDYTEMNVGQLPPLPWAKQERALLEADPYDATPLPVRGPDLLNFLHSGSAEIIHFSCHGNTDVQIPDEATLATEDDANGFRAPLVSSAESRAGAGKDRPLVFLNACQSGAAGEFIGLVFGWPQAFLRMGATACIAPLWKVGDSNAKEVAQLFYESVLHTEAQDPPSTLGEALRRIRGQWKDKKSLTYLGYILYGDPTAKLTWKRASPAVSPSSN